MLSYKTETRPGLVSLYDIRPGNGAGLFLQPRSNTPIHRAGAQWLSWSNSGIYRLLFVYFGSFHVNSSQSQS